MSQQYPQADFDKERYKERFERRGSAYVEKERLKSRFDRMNSWRFHRPGADRGQHFQAELREAQLRYWRWQAEQWHQYWQWYHHMQTQAAYAHQHAAWQRAAAEKYARFWAAFHQWRATEAELQKKRDKTYTLSEPESEGEEEGHKQALRLTGRETLRLTNGEEPASLSDKEQDESALVLHGGGDRRGSSTSSHRLEVRLDLDQFATEIESLAEAPQSTSLPITHSNLRELVPFNPSSRHSPREDGERAYLADWADLSPPTEEDVREFLRLEAAGTRDHQGEDRPPMEGGLDYSDSEDEAYHERRSAPTTTLAIRQREHSPDPHSTPSPGASPEEINRRYFPDAPLHDAFRRPMDPSTIIVSPERQAMQNRALAGYVDNFYSGAPGPNQAYPDDDYDSEGEFEPNPYEPASSSSNKPKRNGKGTLKTPLQQFLRGGRR